MQYAIRHFGDPILREKAQPVPAVDPAVRAIIRNMLDTVQTDGVGLAAQQVGLALALAVIDIPERVDLDENGVRLNPDATMPLVLVNPRIIRFSKDRETREEGCLSFPEIFAPVRRPWEVEVEYLDANETPQSRIFRGFLARAAQHEIDHLQGVLFIDRMSAVKRVALAGRLRRLREQTASELAGG